MPKRSVPVDVPMATNRGVRATSRHMTPTPQPGRVPRAMRSANHDFEFVDAQKPTRRSARHASVTSITSVASKSDNEGLKPRKTRRRPAKEALEDLSMVEEIDTQIALDSAPGTPTPIDLDESAPFRSPGAASEMSGTTAISSFSMIEAEFLEPKFIIKHMRQLCETADRFLHHLVPDNGSIDDDLYNIQEIQKPDSDFTEDYRDSDVELHVHLKHFTGEERNYIRIRAIHRALIDLNSDAVAVQTGVDLVLYLANVLVFAKHMIHSNRSAKDVWDALRQIDNSFPSHFMHSLNPRAQPTAAGESRLLAETFSLALALRTQLAILVLQRGSQDSQFDAEEAISEVFIHMSSSQDTRASGIRGWNVSALGGEDAALPQEFQRRVVERQDEIRQFFLLDAESIQRGETVDIEGLSSSFPWEAVVLEILGWVRLRHRELRTTIEEFGGAEEILKSVKNEMAKPRSSTENVIAIADESAAPAPQRSSREKKAPFRRDRRRHSRRRFDPNAPDKSGTANIKVRENDSGVLFELEALRSAQEIEATQPAAEEKYIPEATPDDQQEGRQPTLGNDPEQPDATLVGEPTLVEEAKEAEEPEELEGAKEDVGNIVPSEMPDNTLGLLNRLKTFSQPEKENRTFSIFSRQTNAQRVEFGDGFGESQPTPGPSNTNKGKRGAEAAPSKKRAREDEDSEEEAFETQGRTAPPQRVQERRVKAPVAKKIRLNPALSGAPPSHQPLRAIVPQVETQEQESHSEEDAPEMTEDAPDAIEEVPLSSTFQDLKERAFANSGCRRQQQVRQPRRQWSAAAEEALAAYMEKYPQQYSHILKLDKEKAGVLQEWTQVNLKDKVRNMAVIMIKSGAGIRPGFDHVVKATDKVGKKLLDDGYLW